MRDDITWNLFLLMFELFDHFKTNISSGVLDQNLQRVFKFCGVQLFLYYIFKRNYDQIKNVDFPKIKNCFLSIFKVITLDNFTFYAYALVAY